MLSGSKYQPKRRQWRRKPLLFCSGVTAFLFYLLLSSFFSSDKDTIGWALTRIGSVGVSSVKVCYWRKTYSLYGKEQEVCLRDDKDLISNFVRTFGRWYDCDASERAIVDRRAKTFLNIGANIGMCTSVAAVHGLSVVAVEANPDNMYYLEKTTARYPNVRVFNFGLGIREDKGLMYMIDANSGASGFFPPGSVTDPDQVKRLYGASVSREVPIHRVDDVLNNNFFDVVLIDTEGFECKIVCGATETILAGKWKYLQTEFEDGTLNIHGCNKKIYLSILTSLGFEKVGQGSAFPFLSHFVTVNQDLYLEWKGTNNVGVSKARTLCDEV